MLDSAFLDVSDFRDVMGFFIGIPASLTQFTLRNVMDLVDENISPRLASTSLGMTHMF